MISTNWSFFLSASFVLYLWQNLKTVSNFMTIDVNWKTGCCESLKVRLVHVFRMYCFQVSVCPQRREGYPSSLVPGLPGRGRVNLSQVLGQGYPLPWPGLGYLSSGQDCGTPSPSMDRFCHGQCASCRFPQKEFLVFILSLKLVKSRLECQGRSPVFRSWV